MARTKKFIPWRKPGIPKNIKRGLPVIKSNPIVDKTNPIKIEKIVLGISSPPRPTKVAKAITIKAKVSGALNLKATSASGGANKVNKITDTVPPTNEPTAAAVRAVIASPFTAKGLPSKTVATAVDAPGIPNITELIAPPYIAP